MAVVNNTATENGDIIQIISTVPIIGLLSLYSFVDETVGEGDSLYFVKTFRYSNNGGLTWSSWLSLTAINIQSVSVSRNDSFIVEYQYERIGEGGDLSFNSVTLSGTYTSLEYPIYERTIFNDYFPVNDSSVLGWALSVLEKLYETGILPTYLDRGYNREDDGMDDDFISFWYTITHFFAILVNYARKFENVANNEILLQEWVNQIGIYFSKDGSIDELLYIFNNYNLEFSKRGTWDVIREAVEDDEFNGELLRLINKATNDEFVFIFINRQYIGWNISNSSPLYRGTDRIPNSSKGYEYTEAVVDLTKYPLSDPEFISVVGDYMVIDTVTEGNISGVSAIDDNTKKIVVDPSLDYEVCFRVKKDNLSVSNLRFGITAYNSGNLTQNLLSSKDDSTTNLFIPSDFSLPTTSEYWIRGVLYNKDKESDTEDCLNIGIGNNLIMTENVNFIIPEIKVVGGATADVVYVRDIKVRPLNFPFSLGQLMAKNFIFCIFKNDGLYSDTDVISIIKKELLPYNCLFNYEIIQPVEQVYYGSIIGEEFL